jgi:predicted PurR-regulated permease PerM
MEEREKREALTKNAVEIAIKISLLGIMVIISFKLIQPFLIPVVWGIILAVAMEPFIAKVAKMLGGKRSLAAVVFVLLIIAALIVPTVLMTLSSIDAVQTLSEQMDSGTLVVPPPPAKVADWPLVGEPVFHAWQLAATNLEGALAQYGPQIKAIMGKVLGSVGGGLVGIFMVIISTCIAGVFLAKSEQSAAVAEKIFTRIAGDKGPEFTALATATIRGVMQGVVGVAVIQAILAAIGMIAVGVPAAGLWSVLVLVCAVAQLPPILVLGPVAAYVFSVADTTPAVLFLIWSLVVAASDGFLKPLLMGRGVDIPMLVILLGALGGMMLSGIIGLFVGAVVLAITYTLFMAWLDENDEEAEAENR